MAAKYAKHRVNTEDISQVKDLAAPPGIEPGFED
jgi:hypothetical protein